MKLGDVSPMQLLKISQSNGKAPDRARCAPDDGRQPALTVIRKNSSVEQQHWFYRVDRIQKFAPAYITVTIDIKPGSYPNSINLGSNGNVPVAIFSTEDFDATTVDPLTITLAGAEVRIRGRGDSSRYYQDVDGDGLEIPEIEYEV